MMGGSDNNKDWPTLNDSNVACASSVKNKHHDNSKDRPRSKESSNVSRINEEKSTSNKKTDVTDGANGLSNASPSTYPNTGARKKQSGKTKWSRVDIDLPSYRDNRSDRNYNESHRFAGSRRYNNNESANNFANGHDNSRGRAFRGGRGGRGQFRFRRETTVNSDSRRYNSFSQEVTSQDVNSDEGKPSSSEILKELIKHQVEYYFSEENLVKDPYLRKHMDEQGYADLQFVSQFPRMVKLTNDMQLILSAVKESSHLEVSDDTKIRPVIDPLRWPLRPLAHETNVVNANAPLDFLTAQIYAMSINPVYYPFPNPGPSHLPVEHVWPLYGPVAVGDPNKNELFYVNNVYPQVDSNCIGAAVAGLEIANGHISSPEQHSPNSDIYCDFTSQFHNSEIKNGTAVAAVPETPVLPNGIGDIASDSDFPNGQTYSSDQATFECNGEVSSQDLHIKGEESFHPVNGSRPNGDVENNASACESVVSNGPECSSQLRHMSEMGAYDGYFGPNGVIMYSSVGHYYVAHSTEGLTNSRDSSDEKSTLHNKSPEPSR